MYCMCIVECIGLSQIQGQTWVNEKGKMAIEDAFA